MAGLACHGGRVVLVREAYPAWGGAFWNIPSGRVEDGESVVAGAVRELAEETGLVVAAAALRRVSTTSTHGADGRSDATNFRVDLHDRADPTLAVADPDGLVHEARWFPVSEAVAKLSRLPYRPLREPAVAHLTEDASAGSHWHFASPDAEPVVSLRTVH